ncbi:B12-binding domain-containing radical SAM protein [Acidobacteriota bacterium]
MLKILLVDANSSWLIKKDDISDLEQIIPPIGLMYIATYLNQQFKDQIQVKIINMVADKVTPQNFDVCLQDFSPDIVGLRGMNIYKGIFHQISTSVKKYNKNIRVFGGGPYATMDVNNAAKDENVDYFVMGEGEITFSRIIGKILKGQSFLDTKGMAYKNQKKLIINDPREFIEDLDSLPFPDYNLISVDKYSHFISYGYNRRRQAIMFSSRGCPYHCIYCHSVFGKKYRARSAQNVFDEIEHLYNHNNIRDFYFVDDNPNLKYQRAMDLFDLIINSGMKLNIYFANGIRGDIIDRAFIDKMVEAGVIWVDFAIETASRRLQKFIKKNVDLDKIVENIHYTCEKNIMVNLCAMVGFPSETKEEAMQTVNFLKQFKRIIIPMFFSVKYYPNTELYGLALKDGIKSEDIEDAYAETYHDIRHSETPLISKMDFNEIYFKFLEEVFLSKERLLNALEIQNQYLSQNEILDVYSIFFRKRIKDIDTDVLRYAQ